MLSRLPSAAASSTPGRVRGLELVVDYVEGRKHLPIVEFRPAA